MLMAGYFYQKMCSHQYERRAGVPFFIGEKAYGEDFAFSVAEVIEMGGKK